MDGNTKNSKIAITANTSWYLYNFRANTIRALINEGYTVAAIAPYDEYSPLLKALGCEFISLKMDSGGVNPFNDSKTLLNIFRVLNKNNFQVILNFTPKNNIYFSLVAGIFSIPVINNVAGLGNVFMTKGVIRHICRHLYRVSQRSAAKIFFQNEDDRKLFLTEIIPGYSRSDRLPGSGVDLNRFSLMQAPDDGVVRFILVARMLYSKGIEHYVDSARKLKKKYGNKCEFRLLGFLDANNPAAVKTERMAAWIDENIIQYLGVSDDVALEVAGVDCVVLPSFYREGVPKSLLEAGAMGKPIITTDNIGCRETVDHGINGFLCVPQSTDSLVSALETMIELSHQERLAMGVRSRQKMVNEFDEEIVIKKYLDAIQVILSPRAVGAHQRKPSIPL